MGWLSDFLKYLSFSKSLTGALFVTSLLLLSGSQISPQLVGSLPPNWRWLVVAVCVFTFTLLSFWAIPHVCRTFLNIFGKIRNSPRLRPLTDIEIAVLVFLGESQPNGTYNIDALHRPNIPKIKIIKACKDLEKRRLLEINAYYDDIVSLTDSGRDYALHIIKQRES